MDRNKPSSSGRSSKGKLSAQHHSSELYLLGSKSSRDDVKNKVASAKNVTDRKRDASIALGSVGCSSLKKVKLTTPAIPSSLKNIEQSSTIYLEYWEQIALECEPSDLVSTVLTAIERQDSDQVVGLICGAIKTICLTKGKSDNILILSTLYLAKIRPTLFCNETITTALVSVLKRDTQHSFKNRSNQMLYILAANLLARGYYDKKQWPESFLKLYIDDAVNDRIWIDHPECSSFVENICTAFNTKIPPKSILQPLTLLNPARETQGVDEEMGDFTSTTSDGGKSNEKEIEHHIQPRYNHMLEKTEKLILDTIKEQLNRRQADCSTRNFLKFLATTSGFVEVRLMAVTRLEIWIHNGKLNKAAQELLIFICYNICGKVLRDQEVLANLVKIRLKTKPLINVYMICLKEILTLQPDTLMIILKYVVQNELSNARNPNNMGMLANMFQVKPDETAKFLAEIYQEFLLQREDCLRTLRVFLRELVKMLRYDINLMVFCKSLMNIREGLQSQISKFEYKDRMFTSLVDLICLCMFLSVSPQIREASVILNKINRRDKGSTTLYNFYSQMSIIQCDALAWMYQIVPLIFSPNSTDYVQTIHKLLFLDIPDQYWKGDQWPPEPERTVLLRLVSEVPLNQDTILSIILIGITKDIPISIPDSVEIIEQIVRRASGLKIPDHPTLNVNKLEIIDFLFSMAEYHHPEEIVLPKGYKPPKLAIISLYWKVWSILLMLSAHNPSVLGSYCWTQYPILKNLMEMCITNQFSDIIAHDDELQICASEKTQILEFETYLAAATSKIVITEQTSLLLSQLMLMDPLGICRKPPNYILDQLKNLNTTQKLGHLLCRCRQPDLLLDIIQRHGTSQALPWLADLVQNSDGDFNHLPVQCLCEFLLANSKAFCTTNSRDKELLKYLQNLLQDESNEHQTSCEVLEYFLRRLSSSSKNSRFLAIKGLKLLLSVFQLPEEDLNATNTNVSNSDWLLRRLPEIPHFIYIKPMIIAQLRAACQVENNPELIMIYIQFIATQTIHDSISDMLEHVIDMSQLIVERSTLFSYIVPTVQDDENKIQTLNCLFIMFNNFLIKLREHNGTHAWPEYPDLLMIHFPDGVELPIHLNVIQAFIILLTNALIIPGAIQIIDYWFPIDFSQLQAISVETSEPVQILPDWLKIKMIKSPVERLVDIALTNLNPEQIVLFVQNFGTPIASMSKLLALLDRAVIEQFSLVKSIILNKAYLTQLVEIQQVRGAKNGHIAIKSLELHSQISNDSIPESNILLNSININQKIINENKLKDLLSLVSSGKFTEEILESTLIQNNSDKSNSEKFRIFAQNLININKKLNIKNQEIHIMKLLNFLIKICKTAHSGHYLQNILQKSEIFSLFRCLMTFQTNEKSDSILKLFIKVLDEYIRCLNSKDHSVLLQILVNKRKIYVKTSSDSVNKTLNQNFIEIFQTAKQFDIEHKGNILVNNLIKKSNTSYLIKMLSSVLKITEVDVKEEISLILNHNKNNKGLIVDWLADIDSELVCLNENIQMDLLFNSSLKQFRFYMLSLLSHQVSWSTLQNTLIKLLEIYNPSFDSTSVLDFISALVNNPKLWQGRDKSTPKHEQLEFILIKLTDKEIQVFIEYILNEKSNLNVRDQITFRIHLLIKSVNFDKIDLKRLINFVITYNSNDPNYLDVKEVFLKNLYLNIPSIKFKYTNLNNIYNTNLTEFVNCPADKLLQYIITTTASFTDQRDYQQVPRESELILRKMAASHPSLFLRQLLVLSGLLQGRAHMNFHVLKNDHHLLLFSQTLSLFEILQPQIFEDCYKIGFQSALKCYFDLLRNHEVGKEILPIMSHFMEFLQAYIQTNPISALDFIQHYSALIEELSLSNHHCIALMQVVQGVGLLKYKGTSNLTTSNNECKVNSIDRKGAAAIILARYTKQPHLHPHYNQTIATITRCTAVGDLLPALQGIETCSTKYSVHLNEIFEKLLELLFSDNQTIRSISYTLLIRYLKNNPGYRLTNLTVLRNYIQCLTHSEANIAISAIENLPEIVICLQEHAADILSVVFNLGISSKLNVQTRLRQCLSALKIQHAC